MPRQSKKKIPDEAAEIGRYIGTLERIGYKELMEDVKAMAKAEGKNVTDKLAEIIRAGIGYEKYKDLKLADAMLVLDFLERVFNNLLYPIMYTTSQVALEAELQKIRTLAGAMGLIPREEAERLAEERARQLLEQLALQQAEQQPQQPEQQPRSEASMIGEFVRTLSRKIAERLGEEIARKIAEGESLEGLMEGLKFVAEQAVKDVLLEEMLGESGEEQGENEAND